MPVKCKSESPYINAVIYFESDRELDYDQVLLKGDGQCRF